MKPALVGRFGVQASTRDIARYSAAFSAGEDDGETLATLPATYPIVWLGRPDIRAALKQALAYHAGMDGAVLIHLSQSIAYAKPLVPDSEYELEVRLSAPDEKGVVVLSADVRRPAGETQATLSGRLALVTGSGPKS
ncbi:MAG: hypothetical protein KKH72_11310 [Alphaproteobacteria bacterium]|nr:hypothetical protein [Alphaproteobacteria bacterium]